MKMQVMDFVSIEARDDNYILYNSLKMQVIFLKMQVIGTFVAKYSVSVIFVAKNATKIIKNYNKTTSRSFFSF